MINDYFICSTHAICHFWLVKDQQKTTPDPQEIVVDMSRKHCKCIMLGVYNN